MSVTRYDCFEDGMSEWSDGDYVLFTDYNKLKETLMEIKEYADSMNWKSISKKIQLNVE